MEKRQLEDYIYRRWVTLEREMEDAAHSDDRHRQYTIAARQAEIRELAKRFEVSL